MNILNKDGLDDIFDVESDHESFFEDGEFEEITDVSTVEDEDEDEETAVDVLRDDMIDGSEEYFLENVKSLMDDVQGIIAAAKYLCDSSPEPETIIAASSMITASSQLLKELNKSAMQLKRFKFMKEHEKMKIKARMDLARFKAENNKKLIMSGGTINIQNNNLEKVEYSQESIVKELLNQSKKKKE
jgi:hypothetical protein